MPDPASTERRRFQRIHLERAVQVSAAGIARDCELVDISLKGALVETPGDWQPGLGTRVELLVVLGDEPGYCIRAGGEVAHVRGSQCGIHLLGMDIASGENLKRLVEVNLGDPALLERELDAMLDDV